MKEGAAQRTQDSEELQEGTAAVHTPAVHTHSHGHSSVHWALLPTLSKGGLPTLLTTLTVFQARCFPRLALGAVGTGLRDLSQRGSADPLQCRVWNWLSLSRASTYLESSESGCFWSSFLPGMSTFPPPLTTSVISQLGLGMGLGGGGHAGVQALHREARSRPNT